MHNDNNNNTEWKQCAVYSGVGVQVRAYGLLKKSTERRNECGLAREFSSRRNYLDIAVDLFARSAEQKIKINSLNR